MQNWLLACVYLREDLYFDSSVLEEFASAYSDSYPSAGTVHLALSHFITNLISVLLIILMLRILLVLLVILVLL